MPPRRSDRKSAKQKQTNDQTRTEVTTKTSKASFVRHKSKNKTKHTQVTFEAALTVCGTSSIGSFTIDGRPGTFAITFLLSYLIDSCGGIAVVPPSAEMPQTLPRKHTAKKTKKREKNKHVARHHEGQGRHLLVPRQDKQDFLHERKRGNKEKKKHTQQHHIRSSRSSLRLVF